MAIAEVIKFEGKQDDLVWKFPVEDFNATSQLIVDETHEALLAMPQTCLPRAEELSLFPIFLWQENLLRFPQTENLRSLAKYFS